MNLGRFELPDWMLVNKQNPRVSLGGHEGKSKGDDFLSSVIQVRRSIKMVWFRV
jgi:hypothetical protein